MAQIFEPLLEPTAVLFHCFQTIIMIDLKVAIIWGATLERIRQLIEVTDSMYLGIFINSLAYGKEAEGKKEKEKYISTLETQVKKINKEVISFNKIRRYTYGKESSLEKLPLVDFAQMRKIVLEHKGHYRSDNNSNPLNEMMGKSDSASSLSRKHTALLLKNVLLPLRIGLGEFVKSMDKFEEPFHEYTSQEKNIAHS